MEFNKVTIKYKSKSEWINLIPLGDCHIGNSCCNLDALKDMVRWIQDKPQTYWLGMGDYIDAINYRDPRFDPKTVSPKYMQEGDIDKIIQLQIGDFVELIEPIRDKCLGLLRGNHEETIRKYYMYDVLYEIIKELDLSRKLLFYDVATLRLVFNRNRSASSHSYDVFCAHSHIGGRTYGHKSNRIRELHGQHRADIYLLAHAHIKLGQIGMQNYYNKAGVLCRRKIIDAWTGGFLEGYQKGKSGYVEKALYPPSDIGVVRVMLQPFTGDKHVSL
jgi:hypothetical protein